MFNKKFKLSIHSACGTAARISLSGRRAIALLVSTPIALLLFAYAIGRFVIPPQDPLTAAEPSVVDKTLEQIEKAFRADPTRVDERLAELKNYEERLQGLETQIRARMGLLDVVLEDATKLDYQPSLSVPLSEETRAALNRNRKSSDRAEELRGGIGGEEGPLPPASTTLLDPISFKELGGTRGDLLIKALDFYNDEIAKIPAGVPVQGRLSSGFGWRSSPFAGARQFHRGIDLSVDSMSGVVATADGVVTKAEYKGGLGRNIIIRHGNGIETVYGHLSRMLVRPGQRVCRGQRIGFVGSTGRSTGPHVHYEVRIRGISRDPRPYIELAGLLRQFHSEI